MKLTTNQMLSMNNIEKLKLIFSAETLEDVFKLIDIDALNIDKHIKSAFKKIGCESLYDIIDADYYDLKSSRISDITILSINDAFLQYGIKNLMDLNYSREYIILDNEYNELYTALLNSSFYKSDKYNKNVENDIIGSKFVKEKAIELYSQLFDINKEFVNDNPPINKLTRIKLPSDWENTIKHIMIKLKRGYVQDNLLAFMCGFIDWYEIPSSWRGVIRRSMYSPKNINILLYGLTDYNENINNSDMDLQNQSQLKAILNEFNVENSIDLYKSIEISNLCQFDEINDTFENINVISLYDLFELSYDEVEKLLGKNVKRHLKTTLMALLHRIGIYWDDSWRLDLRSPYSDTFIFLLNDIKRYNGCLLYDNIGKMHLIEEEKRDKYNTIIDSLYDDFMNKGITSIFNVPISHLTNDDSLKNILKELDMITISSIVNEDPGTLINSFDTHEQFSEFNIAMNAFGLKLEMEPLEDVTVMPMLINNQRCIMIDGYWIPFDDRDPSIELMWSYLLSGAISPIEYFEFMHINPKPYIISDEDKVMFKNRLKKKININRSLRWVENKRVDLKERMKAILWDYYKDTI